MEALLPARWRICCSAVPTKSAAKLRLDFCAGHGEQQELAHAGGHVLLELREQRPSVWRELPGRPPSGSSFVSPPQEQRLDQLALAKADLGHHVPEGRARAQSLQSLHCS
jgi:hypothetical protein